MNLYNT